MECDQGINPEVQILSQSLGGSLPPFLRLRFPTAWPWWENLANKEVLHLLSHGVEPEFACPTLPIIPQGRLFNDEESAMQIISENM